ncbi:MAG: hypothetical protein ACPF9D_04135 [Owenweeksia sp.]
MKSIKRIAAILFISLLSSQAYSQISIGGQVSYLNLFGGSGLKNFGLGVKGDYALNDETVLSGGVNYYLPSTYSDFTYGTANSSQTSPTQIEIDVEYKVSFIHLYFGGRRYFVGDYEDDFGFYGLAEVGLLMAPVTTTLGEYDESRYNTSIEDGAKETLINFTLNLGVGVEKELDFGYIFGDLKLNLPANQANGQYVPVEIPTSLSVNAGVRVPF